VVVGAQTPGAHPTDHGHRQVFWLTDHPTSRAFSVGQPLRDRTDQWPDAAFVPDHSGGSAVELHHLPFSSPPGRGQATCDRVPIQLSNQTDRACGANLRELRRVLLISGYPALVNPSSLRRGLILGGAMFGKGQGRECHWYAGC